VKNDDLGLSVDDDQKAVEQAAPNKLLGSKYYNHVETLHFSERKTQRLKVLSSHYRRSHIQPEHLMSKDN